MRTRRPILALGALATTGALATAGLLATGAVGTSAAPSTPKLKPAASSGLVATPSKDPSTSCNGVLNGAGAGPLTKTLLSVTPNSTPGSYDFTFQVDSGDLVCDRVAVSGTASGTGFTDKSNEVCVDPNNPPVVPEANWAAALPLAALGLTGAVVLYRRRRQLTAPVQVTTTS
jgi:hypothetical protein